jgi:hypothetical protein
MTANIQFSISMCFTVVMAPNRAVVSLRSCGDGNRSSFRNAVSSSYLEHRVMDKVHKPRDSGCYYPQNPLDSTEETTSNRHIPFIFRCMLVQ